MRRLNGKTFAFAGALLGVLGALGYAFSFAWDRGWHWVCYVIGIPCFLVLSGLEMPPWFKEKDGDEA
jgi:hypothetical protein